MSRYGEGTPRRPDRAAEAGRGDCTGILSDAALIRTPEGGGGGRAAARRPTAHHAGTTTDTST